MLITFIAHTKRGTLFCANYWSILQQHSLCWLCSFILSCSNNLNGFADLCFFTLSYIFTCFYITLYAFIRFLYAFSMRLYPFICFCTLLYAFVRLYMPLYAFICFHMLLYAFICFYMLYMLFTCFKSKCVTTRRTTTRPRVTRLPALPAEAGKKVTFCIGASRSII